MLNPSLIHRHVGWLYLLFLSACGGAVSAVAPASPPPLRTTLITPATADAELRRFHTLDFDDPDRARLRDKLLRHLLDQSARAMAGDDYEAVVETFSDIMDLYTPEELTSGQVPDSLDGLARYLLDAGSSRGEPARVMSVLLLLRLLHPEDASLAKYYRRLEKWALDTESSALGDPMERYEGPLRTLEEHARLTPAPEVLERLVKLYLAQCHSMVAYYRSGERRFLAEIGAVQSVQKTSLMIAAVYLREADIASALTGVEAMSTTGNVEEGLVDILRLARQGGETGAGATLDLATAYLKGGRADVALALCRSGLRTNRGDPRFPQCLGRIAATEDDYAGAAAWYAKAISMTPDSRPLYDETLAALNELMEQDRYDTDPTVVRRLAARATEVLSERIRRWPETPTLVTPEALHLLIAVAEMNAGNAEEAEKQLRQSVDERESVEALLQLGFLHERIGRAREAEKSYRRALELVDKKSLSAQVRSAEILEHIGDALRSSRDREQADKNYQQALGLWDASLPALEGPGFGLAQVRRGVLLGRLGQNQEAGKAFELAMQYAPGSRETYASILSFLVVGAPDLDLGYRAYNRAFIQLSLDPEWKVYFSLWVRAIEARAGRSLESEIDGVLESMVRETGWWAQLARFGVGKLDYAELLARASGVGERAEAHFYQAMRLLRAGDTPGASRFLHRVIETRMVNFYEFAMAQELLRVTEPVEVEEGE